MLVENLPTRTLQDWRNRLAREKKILNLSEKSVTGVENTTKITINPSGAFHVQIDTTGDGEYVSDILEKAMKIIADVVER